MTGLPRGEAVAQDRRMTFWWDAEEEAPETPVKPRGRRGLVLVAFGVAGWLLLVPLLWLGRTPFLAGSIVGLSLTWLSLFLGTVLSISVILIACLRRSWVIALVCLALSATAIVVTVQQNPQIGTVDHQYRAHRAELADLAEDYRAGHLDSDLTLPSGLRSLCPSGFAYAAPTVLFVQMWQNWRAESGTGLAYFPQPPTAATWITTAEGDNGRPQREVGDGWWWVA
ncbi:hypothetical protein [Paractinoplanes atraurantiacus]|uniref:Uncharacterized protein n=1 Tax=Paractinoplanes atraurantiacus TaxID=1036182 RepID=A0A285KAD1_9ACTN|nr:hypothetical protein [Actinoplanes atraurantiacus]SNY69569.1 hypothetical protein SAMN05421748_13576 [Actinoplanes atraurantiacus]